jgi:sensor histidine kinase YesM
MAQPTPIPITLEGFLLKVSMRYKIILVISLLLLTAIIILVILSILRSSNATSDADVLV